MPDATGVHEQDAVPLETVTAEHPERTPPLFLNATVPDAPSETVAVSVYAVPARGEAGMEPRVTVADFHGATPVMPADGRLVAPESTAETRTS